MLPTKSKSKSSREKKSVRASVAAAAVCALVITAAYWSWTSTPQLAPSDEVYASVDALFTAVTARRAELVAQCETELASLQREGKIPQPAWQRLSRAIALAKSENWEPAAKDLYRFIERQRRSK